jgi:hypothetical protein
MKVEDGIVRLVSVFFAPALFIGGWHHDLGKNMDLRNHLRSADVLDLLLFLLPAILFVVYGIKPRLLEWLLRFYFLCWFGFIAIVFWQLVTH